YHHDGPTWQHRPGPAEQPRTAGPAARRPGPAAAGGRGGPALRWHCPAPAADRPSGPEAARPDDPPGGPALPVAGGGESRPGGVHRTGSLRYRPVGQPPPSVRRGAALLPRHDAGPARTGGFAGVPDATDAPIAFR